MARLTRLTRVSLIGAIVSAGFALEAGAATLVTVQYQQSPGAATTVNGSFEYLQDHKADNGMPGVFDFLLNGMSSADKHTCSYTLPSSSASTETCVNSGCNMAYTIVANNGTTNYSMHVTWKPPAGVPYEVLLTFKTLVPLTKSLPLSNAFWQNAIPPATGTFSCIVDGTPQVTNLPITVTAASSRLEPILICPPTVTCYPVYAQPRRGCCLTQFFARNRFRLCRR